MRFKVDEDLPGEITLALCAAGHDAISVLNEQLGGAPDSEVWAAAQREQRCLFTADKGFAALGHAASIKHAGIVLLRLPRENRTGYLQLVETVLSQFRMEIANGTVVSVSPDVIRVHGKVK